MVCVLKKSIKNYILTISNKIQYVSLLNTQNDICGNNMMYTGFPKLLLNDYSNKLNINF